MHRRLVLVALFVMMLASTSLAASAQSPPPDTDVQANKDLILSYYIEVWDQGNADAVYEILAPDFQWWFGTTELFLVGPDEVKEHVDTLNSSIEGMGLTVDIILAEGDLVAVRWSLTSTPEGTPSTATVLCTGNDIWRIESGLAAEVWAESVDCA